MSNSEHEWKFTGRPPHNDLGWYRCLKCGATDWLPPYGTLNQLKPEKCEPAVEEAPAPLACHVCGSTSSQHFNGCGIAEFCPETGRPIPRDTGSAPEENVESDQAEDAEKPTPCPFCGHGGVSVAETSSFSFSWRAVICEKCAAQGPEVRCKTSGEGTRKEWEEECRVRCIEAWNKRSDDVLRPRSRGRGQFCSVASPPPLTKEEKNLLLHTLCGLNHDEPSYRNRYFVYPSSDVHLILERLEDRGFMEETSVAGVHELLWYRATATGAAAVGKTLPKKAWDEGWAEIRLRTDN